MQTKKENRGGKRKGSGRKPSEDKKQTVCLYIETSKIENAGGMEKMKERLYSSLGGVNGNYGNSLEHWLAGKLVCDRYETSHDHAVRMAGEIAEMINSGMLNP